MIIEYDGTPFHGWQRQRAVPTVQGSVESAIFAFCGQRSTLQAAGRTDKSVHACAQCAHVDLQIASHTRPVEDVLRAAVNFYLKPLPIVVCSVEEVDEDFHARFSALRRAYLYRVFTRAERSVLALARMGHYRVPAPLDVQTMREGARCLLGTHDFSSFCGAHCQASTPVRTIERLRIEPVGQHEIRLAFTAPSFLYHQVRLMTSALVALGAHHLTLEAFQEQFASRRRFDRLAPAHGLFFLGADYPDLTSPCAAWAQAPEQALF